MSDEAEKRARRLVGGIVLYAVGAGALGAIIGLMTGMSETSAVTTVLGAVFALLGGAGSFYLPWAQAVPATSRQTAADAVVNEVIPKLAEQNAALALAAEAAKGAATADNEAEGAVSAAKSNLDALVASAPEAERNTAKDAVTAAETARTITAEALATAKAAEAKAAEAANAAKVLLDETVTLADDASKRARDVATDGFAKTFIVSGSGLLLFSLGFGLALLYGVLLRTGSNWGDLLPQARVIELPAGADAATQADAVLLDRILAALRVESATRKAITSQLQRSCANEVGREELAIQLAFASISTARAAGTEIKDTTDLQLLFQTVDPSKKTDLNIQRDLIKSALLESTKVVQLPETGSKAPAVVTALNTFITTSVDYLDCSGSDTILANVLAKLVSLEGTSVKTIVSGSNGVTVEDGLNR